MKKFLLFLSVFSAFFFFTCKKNNDPLSFGSGDIVNESQLSSGIYSSGSTPRALANEAAVTAAFTLDYSPQKAEPVNEAETLSVQELAGSSQTAGGGGIIVGGGLRKLTDYKTSYLDPAKETAKIAAIRASQEEAQKGIVASTNNEPLTVIDWGPRGEFSSAVQRPSVYVIFSQPMTALASLGEASSASPVVSISPPIKGTFRWYGTAFLSFEGEEPCQAQQTYTITVAANAESVYKNRITGDRIFTFHTETLSIKNAVPGEEFRKNNPDFWFDNNSVPPAAAKSITLEFNYPVQAADMNRHLEITIGGSTARFTLKQLDSYKLLAELQDNVGFDTQVRIVLKKGAMSKGGTRGTESDRVSSFRTPAPFKVNRHDRRTGYGKYSNLVEIYFSHALNESTVRGKVTTDPAMNVGADNIEVSGNTVRLYNLPVTFGSRFKFTISTGVEDIYGRKLSEPYTADIVMPNEPPPQGSVQYLDYRNNVMLESQFPPRYLFEYTNILPGSSYAMASVGNPYLFTREKGQSGYDDTVILNTGEKNKRNFELIDLKKYLNDKGKGFVGFRSDINVIYSERQNNDTYIQKSWKSENAVSIQVTDIGVTARYGFNKATVLVTSLSTGLPVEGAVVKLLNPGAVEIAGNVSEINPIIEGKTNKDGFAVLSMNSLMLRQHTENPNHWRGFSEPYIFTEKDGDKAIFVPNTHSTWSFGISSAIPQTAIEIIPSAFMFSDRGLYKPGETVTFRGVDRSRVIGMYTIYSGDHTVVLEENTYRPEQVAVINGKTTDSGSFYGSIYIPEDTRPGNYRLVYRRGTGTDGEIIGTVSITVAFFERLKFQASLSSPAVPVIMGDDINLNLQASYLSGGSLSGASWEAAWYEERTWYRTNKAETRNFSFGPMRGWDSNRNIGTQSGVLSGQGTASISQKTGGGKIIGAPYYYRAEARVTDISNQMITAYRTVMVHPASFYVGLNKKGGFTSAGQAVSIDYVTVDTQGDKTANNSLFLQTGEDARKLKVELVREEWRRVQQRGVNGYVYDEYSPQQVVDSEQMITIAANGSGSIRVTPSRAGYHILRVSGKDREGRTALTEIGFYITGSGGYWNMSNPTEISLTPDQEMYEPGDTAKILMQSALPEGHYLITVEREGIFTEEVRHFKEPVTVIDIPIARNFVPVVYVAISSYSVRSGPPSHEYGGSDLDKPKGYFGVVRLNVNPRVRAFSVKIESDKKTYRPGEEVTMTLTATRDGKPLPEAELTLMAVDRGVLDLIGYHVPDPIEYFYSHGSFPLSVYGGDSRAMLMDPVTYSVKNLAGGDADGDSKIEERKDFNPTAVFEPMLVTDVNGKVTCKFKLPDNLTTYRVTAFGVRGDLFALKESEIAAQNRINVREVVPRRMRERDTAEAGVLITNLDSVSHTLTVKLDIADPAPLDVSTGLVRIMGQAFVDGTAERKVTVKSGENAVVYFDIGAQKAGSVNLNFSVRADRQDVLNERLIREIVIERPIVMETVTATGTVTASGASEGIIIPSFADNIGSLTITLDATRLGLIDEAVTYLFRYPYGCLEQRSSAVFPLVVFGEYLDALSLKSEVKDPKRVVENELRSWGGIQLSNGGMPYWPSGTRADFYVSLRIAHIIAIARQKNITVPSSFNTRNLVSYLNREYQEIQKWQKSSTSYYYQSYLQAYMLYVFSLLGETVDPSRLTGILARDNVDPSVLAFVGMTYRNMGRTSDAANAAQQLRNLMRLTTRGVDITDPLEKNRYSFYGNSTEQLALSLQFFVDQYPGDDINGRLIYSLIEAKRANSGYWNNTADTVCVLAAVDALIRAENLTALNATGSVALAGAELLNGTFRGLGAKPVTQSFEFTNNALANLPRDKMQTINFSQRGSNHNLYYTASLRYSIPAELQSFRDEGIGVFLSLYDIKTGEEVKTTALKSGTTYRARVRVSSSRDRYYLALRVPVPSGAEILDATFVTTASYADAGGASGNDAGRNTSWISHQTIYDNEIQYFWDYFYKGENTVNFLFRTARRGVYPTPPVQAECMYEPEIFGRSKGLIYTIE